MKNVAILLTDKFTSHPRSTLNIESCIEEKSSNMDSCFMFSSDNIKSMSRFIKSRYNQFNDMYNEFTGHKVVYLFMGYSETLSKFSEQELESHYKSLVKVINSIGFDICVCSLEFVSHEPLTDSQYRYDEFLSNALKNGFLKGYDNIVMKLKPSRDKSLNKISVIINSKSISKHFDDSYEPEIIVKGIKKDIKKPLPTGRPLKKVKNNSIINIDIGAFG